MNYPRGIAALMLALALAACGGGESKETAGPTLPPKTTAAKTTEAAPTSTAKPEPERSARGAIIKKIGEEGGFGDDAIDPDKLLVKFSVDSIAPADCDEGYEEYGDAPENGHLTAVAIRMSTDSAYPNDYGYSMSPFDWSFVGADGITHSELATSGSWSCAANGGTFTSDTVSPASQYVGTVVLDLPAPHGTLIYDPLGSGGWEWSF